MRARDRVAVIDEARCVGCTRCIRACPVDAIVGADQLMHTVVEAWCIGCDLCLPACPVDCIDMQPLPAGRPWSAADARTRAARREARWRSETAAPAPADAPAREKRRAALGDAIARSRARRASRAGVKS